MIQIKAPGPLPERDCRKTAGPLEKPGRGTGMQATKAARNPGQAGSVLGIEEGDVNIAIAPDKVFFVIAKSREFDAQIDEGEPDPGSHPIEDDVDEMVQDYGEDPTYDEVTEFIGALNEEEQVNLVALTWLGRGDFTVDEWDQAVREARSARSDHTASYLLGIPLLSDYLEEALTQHGYALEDMEAERP